MKCDWWFLARRAILAGLLLSILYLIPSAPMAAYTPSSRNSVNGMQPDNQGKPVLYDPFVSSFPNLDEYEQCITDPVLQEWIQQGTVPDNLRFVDDEVSVIFNVKKNFDWTIFEDRFRLVRCIQISDNYLIQGFVKTPWDLEQLLEYEEIGLVQGDVYKKWALHTQPLTKEANPLIMTPSVLDLTGVSQVQTYFPDINGSGVIVGVVDSGVDFGVTDISEVIALDEFGQPLSYDPGGSGIAITSYTLPSVGGYLLTEGLDFYMYRNDGTAWWSNSTYGIYSENLYVGAYGGVVSQSGFYKVGMSVQIADNLPEGRAFFIFVLCDATIPFIYDTVFIDFETSWALTANFNGLDMQGPSAEWDFTNNNPHTFADNPSTSQIEPILATDFSADGFNDYSMGSLCTTFDLTDQITGEHIAGIDPQGRGFAFMYDNHGHGTGEAVAIAGHGTQEYDIFGNGTMQTVPGIAPGVKIMALKTFTIADDMWTWFWGCGYRPTPGDYPYPYYENWTFTGTHQSDILSNAWGWTRFNTGSGYDMVKGYDHYTMAIDWLSYSTGTLFVNLEGAAGPGYGTSRHPHSVNALMVAPSNQHFLVPSTEGSSYEIGGIGAWSSCGPTPMGTPGPDIVAPQLAYSVTALHNIERKGDTAFSSSRGAVSIATGICALVKQANTSLRSDGIKTLIMNGAEDLSYDIYRQGAGRVNAYQSVNMAFGNATNGVTPLIQMYSFETFYNLYQETRSSPWRGWYMNMYYGGSSGMTPFERTSLNFYGNYLKDGKVFPQPIYRGDSYEFNVTANTGSLRNVGIESLSAYTYQLQSIQSTLLQATTHYTTFNLTAEFDPSFLAQFYAADYAMIHLTYPSPIHDLIYQASEEGNQAFLFDWQDRNHNSAINPSLYEGRCITADTSCSNCHQLCIGTPGTQFNHTPAIYYYDVGSWLYHHQVISVNVTILLYSRVPWSWITTRQYSALESSDYPLAWNISLTVPVDATPGMYQGYLEAVNGSGVTHLPLSVRVDAQLSAPGTPIIWGGSQGTPYDNGATFGGINFGHSLQCGDWRYYFVDAYPFPPATPPSFLFVNVTWSDPNTQLDVILYYSSYGYVLEESDFEWVNGQWQGQPTWECQQVILLDVARYESSRNYTLMQRGYIGIAIRTSQFGGAQGGPEDFWITCAYGVQNHPVTTPGTWEVPTVWINATDISHTMSAVTENSSWTGPHVTFHTNWSQLSIPEFPTIRIRRTQLEILTTSYHRNFGTLEGPVLRGWHPDHNPREGYDYVWLPEGAYVQVIVEYGTWKGEPGFNTTLSHQGWLDLFIWAPGDAHTYANSLSGAYSGCYFNPQYGSFIAPVTGNYTLGLDIYAGEIPMGWKSEVISMESTSVTYDGLAASIDTEIIDRNYHCTVRSSFITGTSLDSKYYMYTPWQVWIDNIGITNFFPPEITSLEPNGGEVLGPEPITISWTAYDPNAAIGDEILNFTVEISNNSGLTWKVISFDTKLTSILWDPHHPDYGLPASDQYLVRVNCSDGRYTVSRTSAGVFTIEPFHPIIYPWVEIVLLSIGLVVICILVLIIAMVLIRRYQRASKQKPT